MAFLKTLLLLFLVALTLGFGLCAKLTWEAGQLGAFFLVLAGACVVLVVRVARSIWSHGDKEDR